MTDPDPQFTTDSIEELQELLARAENWADVYASDTIAAEFGDARAFVASELAGEPEVAADD